MAHLVGCAPVQAVSVCGISAGLVVCTQALQQQSGALWDVVHQSLAIALHVALGLIEGQPPNVAEGLLVVLLT